VSYEPVHGSSSSILRMTGVGVTPYSARGLTQTLQPIDASKSMKRAIDGAMVDISAPQFRKFASTISGSDQRTPALDGIWPGREVEVECISELSYVTAESTAQRLPVDGSERVEGIYTFYRPVLTMMVMDYSTSTDEYGATVNWTLALEEV
jgi:hypothetical protein